MIIALVTFSIFCGCSDEECDLDRETRDLVQAGLTDCGIADGAGASAAEECALDAHRQGHFFRVMHETSDALEAFVSAGGGEYYLLRTEGTGSPIEQATCAGAVVVTEDGVERVECDQPGEFSTVCE